MRKKEVQREKLRTRRGKRAWNFERRIWVGNGGELARQCWEEITVREGEETELTKWEEKRYRFFGERERNRNRRDWKEKGI